MLSVLRHITTWILLMALTIGYAGVPISKMICTRDGHMAISLLGQAEGCKHDTKPLKKSCCESTHQEENNADEPCCHYEHAFSKLNAAFTINASNIQIKAVEQFLYVFAFCSPVYSAAVAPAKNVAVSASPPPLLQLASSLLPYLQVFRL